MISQLPDQLIQAFGNSFGTLVSLLWPYLLIALAISVVRHVFSLATVKGAIGEIRVKRILGKLDSKFYHKFHDIYLPRPDGKGTTQIDHIIVSSFGIFVIETKNMKGWIFGNKTYRQWTQSLPGGKKFKFQNPLHQNELHIRALRISIDQENHYADHFHNVVFFVGDAKFKTEVPTNVMSNGLLKWITCHKDEVINLRDVDRITNSLLQHHQNTDKQSAKNEHIRLLQAAS